MGRGGMQAMTGDTKDTHGMSQAAIETIANEIRAVIQERTCCAAHAGEMLMFVMAGFALDDAEDDRAAAGVMIRREADALAKRIEGGTYTMVRGRQ